MLNSQVVSKKNRVLVITGTTGFDSLVRKIDESRELEKGYDITLQTGEGAYQPKHKPSFDFDKGLKDRLHEYFQIWKMLPDDPNCFDAIHAGHCDIHQNDIWSGLPDMFQQVLAVFKSARTVKAFTSVEQMVHADPITWIVLKNNNTNVH